MFPAGWSSSTRSIWLPPRSAHARRWTRSCADVRRAGSRRHASQPVRWTADYSGQTFKHILVPIWLLGYNFGARTFQVVVNGYTGEIAGEHPLSWVKIALAILVGVILVAIVALLARS